MAFAFAESKGSSTEQLMYRAARARLFDVPIRPACRVCLLDGGENNRSRSWVSLIDADADNITVFMTWKFRSS